MERLDLRSSWRDRVQELVGRRRDRTALIGVVAVVATVSAVLALRPSPAIAPPAQGGGPPPPVPSATAPSPSNAELLVHVAGAVRKPGLYRFPPGARVADAVESAGGPRPGANLDALNLAEPLVDGSQVLVGKGPAPASAAPVPTTGAVAPVNVNVADQVQLETIPGIGPVTATAIIEQRTQAGPFTSFEDLLAVDGIGPATLESIRPYITL